MALITFLVALAVLMLAATVCLLWLCLCELHALTKPQAGVSQAAPKPAVVSPQQTQWTPGVEEWWRSANQDRPSARKTPSEISRELEEKNIRRVREEMRKQEAMNG